jgi:hypothetical protein
MKKIFYLFVTFICLSSFQQTFAQNAGLIPVPFDPSQYGFAADGGFQGYTNNNPSGATFGFGFSTFGSYTYNLTQNGGPWNDEIRSASFAGNVNGRVFQIYDNSGGSTGDDWVTITFKKNPPAGYSYMIYSLEQSYSDEYVDMVYHDHGNLDGKVSRIVSYRYI